MSLLVFNAGSTSLKFAVFDTAGAVPAAVARGGIAPLNKDAVLRLQLGAGQTRQALPVDGMQAAVRECLALLQDTPLRQSPATAVAHRIVCGEPGMGDIARVDEDLLKSIQKLAVLAPLHQKAEIDVVRAVGATLGGEVPAYAAFDTGFFRDLPAVASTYALPAELRERFGIRRSGFHGFAHRSMLDGYCAAAGVAAGDTRVISFQLGGGCSAAAVLAGRPLDTSMGYTPLEGLVMDTRSGDLDAGIVFECLRHGIPAHELYETLERRSGLLGLSGIAADLRTLQAEAGRGNAAARLAVDVYCHRARKYLGAYLAVLGGADAVLFGGGVGEHQPEIRARICAGLQWCGLELDAGANAQAASLTRRISTAQSRIAVYVVPVDEEAVIAREVLRFSRAADDPVRE
ncbi:MAG: acetate/propionate family kinase [Nevskia sp.]|nr:acetate/propionate family kinase [Nevskia sp.]